MLAFCSGTIGVVAGGKIPRGSLPAKVWIGFAILLTMCVPWYFPRGAAPGPGVWAFPFWGAVVVGFSILLAIYTAFIYLYVWDERAGRTPRRRR